MYITEVPNRGGKPTTLLRESYRHQGRVKNRTLANLTKLPAGAIDALRRTLAGEQLIGVSEAFSVVSSSQHGHVDAVMSAMRRLKFSTLIPNASSRQAKIVTAMIAARINVSGSKLDTTRWLSTTSLLETLGISDVTTNELYSAMDWLLERQKLIEKRLAKRHLRPGGNVLYDLTSTWLEGQCCPLAAYGYSRDGKKGKKQVNFGLLANDDGCPIAVDVFKGNTADPQTVQQQVNKIQDDFKIESVIFVGDRGMLTEKRISELPENFEWISALRNGAIQKLHHEGHLQLDLFDERNLFEFRSSLYPKERLVACRNAELARRRARKRDELLTATETELDKILASVRRGRLKDRAKIGMRAGRVINKHKVAKHFRLEIADSLFNYERRVETIAREKALDGIYIVRTSVSVEKLSADDAVRHYKRLVRIERSFRSMKTVTENVRPVYHWNEDRVRAHIFLCMLSYYVEWHLRRVWAPLLFGTEEHDAADTRDPVAAAKPTASTKQKTKTKKTLEGYVVHSFRSLLKSLATITKNQCRRRNAPEAEATFYTTTELHPHHKRAFGLIREIQAA